ncbi:MAG TPA: M23 family metallopeptidase [Candidatus Limnocylindria bacterium]|nr:M23 family metallopeptidase [Candidatus Limnocylindria bacterium]
MRPVLAVLGVVVFGAIAVAATAARTPVNTAPQAVARAYATADPANTDRVDLGRQLGRSSPDEGRPRSPAVRGLLIPIEGAPLPTQPELLPNSARDYRAGWHEGIDFPAARGTPVHAAAAGTIVRVDRDFVDWDAATLAAATERAIALGYTPEETLDRIRGRQVWIDHGRGVVTRYAHLDSVADLHVGDPVARGQVVGAVGSSGFEEGGPHLHLEVRVGEDYLGDWLEGDALVSAIRRAFD